MLSFDIPTRSDLLGPDGTLNIMTLLLNTPWWTYAILLALFLMGLRESRQRVVRQSIVFGMLGGMVIISFISVVTSFELSLAAIILWAIGLSCMTGLSYRVFPLQGAEFETVTYRFLMPGSWVPFIFTLGIFMTKYTVIVLKILGVSALAKPGAMLGLSLLYGVFSGLFFSRCIHLWQIRQLALLNK